MTIKQLQKELERYSDELGPDTPVCIYIDLEESYTIGNLTTYIAIEKDIYDSETCLVIFEE